MHPEVALLADQYSGRVRSWIRPSAIAAFASVCPRSGLRFMTTRATMPIGRAAVPHPGMTLDANATMASQ
jgi:hypothetical protein